MRLLVAVVTVLASLICAPASAQTQNITWQRVIDVEGDRGEIGAMAITADGNIVVGGALTQPVDFMQGEANDAWLAMFAPDGVLIWSRQFGGDVRDNILGLAISGDGSIIVTGDRNMFARQSAHSINAFAAKFSPSGDLLWDTIIADDAADVSLWQVMVAPDGSALLGGKFKRFGDGGGEPLVIKLSPDGKVRWRAIPRSPSLSELGGFTVMKPDGRKFPSDRVDLADFTPSGVEVRVKRSAMTHDLDAGCVVLGLVDGEAIDGPCSEASRNGFSRGAAFSSRRAEIFDTADVVVRRADDDGGVLWERTFETPAGDGLFDMAATGDGGVVGVGFSIAGERVTLHNWDGLIVRLDAEGAELWRHIVGGNKRDELKAVEVLPDGSIIVAGFTGSQDDGPDWAPWIMRLNPQGELEGAALKELQERQF